MALLAAGSAVPSALVALTVFRASAWACLLCFTSYNERLQICQIFVGLESPDLEKCEEALTDAFKGLQDTEISEETPHILQGPEGGMWREGPERPGETEGNKGSETGGWRLCGGQRLRDGRTEALRGPETGGQRLCGGQRREDRGFAGARGSETGGQRLCGGQRLRDGRTEALRGPEAQRREDRGFAGARGSETGGQRLCGGQRLRDGRTEALRRPEAQREAEEGPLWGCGVGEPLRPSSCLRPPDYEERSHLHDAFTQMTHSLQEVAAAQGSFQVAFPHAAEKMQKIILQLKEVQACIRPCGLQEVARRFRCRGCYSTVCDLPLDCPVQDLTVTRGHQAMFFCTVNFQLPKEEITYSWKFAGGLRTQDLSYFREIPRARGYLARIRPVQPTHRGTFSCVITHDQRPLARLYFFLNGPPPRGETELQVSFREVLRWTPREGEMIEPWTPSLGELLARPEALTPGNQCLLAAAVALASASATVLAWMFFRWYCSGD
ncbi:sperm acrosome membrane-associated protein 6 isoform X2 [Pseudorca crassidens]|uniref:sperm acrosome membrane-associated protein 6 isoform X2 n=1 Tax=Pseudorca crassidens TaxID=82174 RepID=UPI00352EDE4A